jgi:hypothetical protein
MIDACIFPIVVSLPVLVPVATHMQFTSKIKIGEQRQNIKTQVENKTLALDTGSHSSSSLKWEV